MQQCFSAYNRKQCFRFLAHLVHFQGSALQVLVVAQPLQVEQLLVLDLQELLAVGPQKHLQGRGTMNGEKDRTDQKEQDTNRGPDKRQDTEQRKDRQGTSQGLISEGYQGYRVELKAIQSYEGLSSARSGYWSGFESNSGYELFLERISCYY